MFLGCASECVKILVQEIEECENNEGPGLARCVTEGLLKWTECQASCEN